MHLKGVECNYLTQDKVQWVTVSSRQSDKGCNYPFFKNECVPYISFPFNVDGLSGVLIEGISALLLLLFVIIFT